VHSLEALGLDRARAVSRVAAETGIHDEKVRWCADASCEDATLRHRPLAAAA
jgi:hypothetical protein